MSLAEALGLWHKGKSSSRRGPSPNWLGDPQLSAHLLRDTGLSPEDLGGVPVYDQTKPFFMQQTLR
ncbi:MAG: hypothetical protein R3D97_05255 [Paracoccaceae bacterium]